MYLTLATATTLCAAMTAILRPLVPARGRVELIGFDGIGVIVAFIAYVLFAALLGNAFAVSALAAVFIHEMGHVLAHNMLGRGTSRFRMIPLLNPIPVEEHPLGKESEVFFVALMGAGFSLAPLAFALAMSLVLRGIAPALADNLMIFGATIGALNFLLLLPFPPLNGGRCAHIAARNFWPGLGPGMTVFMISAFAMAGIRTGSIALMVLAAFGVYGLFRKTDSKLKPMGAQTGLVALAAYTFTMAAHFTGGWMLFGIYF